MEQEQEITRLQQENALLQFRLQLQNETFFCQKAEEFYWYIQENDLESYYNKDGKFFYHSDKTGDLSSEEVFAKFVLEHEQD